MCMCRVLDSDVVQVKMLHRFKKIMVITKVYSRSIDDCQCCQRHSIVHENNSEHNPEMIDNVN